MRARFPYHFQDTVATRRGQRSNVYQDVVESGVHEVCAGDGRLVLRFGGFEARRGEARGTTRPSVDLVEWRGHVWESLLQPSPDGTRLVPVTVDGDGVDLSLHCTDVFVVDFWHKLSADGHRMLSGAKAPDGHARRDAREAASKAADSFLAFGGIVHRRTEEPVLWVGADGALALARGRMGDACFRVDEADLAIEEVRRRSPAQVPAARDLVASIEVLDPAPLRVTHHDEGLRRQARLVVETLRNGLRHRPKAAMLAYADVRDALGTHSREAWLRPDAGMLREALEAAADALAPTSAPLADLVRGALATHAERAGRLAADVEPSPTGMTP